MFIGTIIYLPVLVKIYKRTIYYLSMCKFCKKQKKNTFNSHSFKIIDGHIFSKLKKPF